MSPRRNKYEEKDETLDTRVVELIDEGYDPESIVIALIREGFSRSEIKESIRYLS